MAEKKKKTLKGLICHLKADINDGILKNRNENEGGEIMIII